jgi:hypothetical protein
MPKKGKKTRKRLQGVIVRGELRREPDWDKFAYAMLRYARLVIEEEKRKQTKTKRRKGGSP